MLYFAAQDWWVMEIDSFTNQIASKVDIQVLSDSPLLVISRSDKERLYEEVPKCERLFRIMSQKAGLPVAMVIATLVILFVAFRISRFDLLHGL